MCLWFPRAFEAETLAIVKTFATVFDNTTVWNGPHHWGIYLIGTIRETSREEVEAAADRIVARPGVVNDLLEYDRSCATSKQLRDLLWLDRSSVHEVSAYGVLITDNDPFTEFFLWRYLRNKEGY